MLLSPIVRTMRFSAEAGFSAETGFSAQAGKGRSRNINTADKTNDRVLFTAVYPFFASETLGPLQNPLQITIQKTIIHYNLLIWITLYCSCIIV